MKNFVLTILTLVGAQAFAQNTPQPLFAQGGNWDHEGGLKSDQAIAIFAVRTAVIAATSSNSKGEVSCDTNKLSERIVRSMLQLANIDQKQLADERVENADLTAAQLSCYDLAIKHLNKNFSVIKTELAPKSSAEKK